MSLRSAAASADPMPPPPLDAPDVVIDPKEMFGVETSFPIRGFSSLSDRVPDLDPDYLFDPSTTLGILAGFSANRRVLISGEHGTGKSTHIEQVAARLRWPCARVNLDGHVSRADLIGKDAIILRDGKQVTEFREGILPWSMQRPTALVFDEYDAGRPDVMFAIQQVLESEGRLTLPDSARTIRPHGYFRLFATANTIGLGDASGLYHGTQPINQGQMDRWSLTLRLSYMSSEREASVVRAKSREFLSRLDPEDVLIDRMVGVAGLVRRAFMNGEMSTVMSPRTVIAWAENAALLGDLDEGFRTAFLNRCDESERSLAAEFYQKCLDRELSESLASRREDVSESGSR